MRTLPLLLAAGLAVAGCSGDPETATTASPSPTVTATPTPTSTPTPEPTVTVEVTPVTVDDPDRVGQAPPDGDTDEIEQQARTWADELAGTLLDGEMPDDDVDDRLGRHRDDGDLTITATGHLTHNGPLLAATVATDSHTTDVVAVDIDGSWTIVDLETR